MGSQARKEFPFELRSLRPEETAAIKENFGDCLDFVRVGPKGFLLGDGYMDDAEKIYNTPIKTGDVIVNSFPRSGTTWVQELVWLINMDLDFETAHLKSLSWRYTFLEFSSIFNLRVMEKLGNDVNISKLKDMEIFNKSGSEILADCPSPRFIKTHLPMSLLPAATIDTAKLVYVARDPRDVVVSFYHHNRLFRNVGYKGTFKKYWELFRSNLVMWSPYFEQLKEAWALRDHPNVLFCFYEQLSEDLSTMAYRVAKFFNKELSEKQVADLCGHLSFENFKKNDSVNLKDVTVLGALDPNEDFIRKGKTGGWREYFDEKMSEEARSWIQDNLRDTDLRFPHLQI